MSSSSRLESIDLLRGVAALAVICRHIPPFGNVSASGSFSIASYFMALGYLGVPLFIVISGFCIHRKAAMQGYQNTNWVAFWRRRIWRLYPPYLAAMILSVAVAQYVAPYLLVEPGRLGMDAVSHLFMVHNLTLAYQFGMGNAAFWSLGMEEQLYGLYALLLLILSRHGGWRAAVCVVLFAALCWSSVIVLAGAPFADTMFLNRWWFWPVHWWLLWTLGALAVESSTGRTTIYPWCSSLTVAALLCGISLAINRETARLLITDHPELAGLLPQFTYMLSEFVAGLAFFVLMNWMVSRERVSKSHLRPFRLITWIGTFSYSIYLVHIPTVATLREVVFGGKPTCHWVVSCSFYALSCVAAGWIFFVLVERHFVNGGLPRAGDERS